MDKNLIIIRACPKHDALAHRCIMSFMDYVPNAEYVLFEEAGEYPKCDMIQWLKRYQRGCMSNFGGRDNVRPYLGELKSLWHIANIENRFGNVIISDSDIIVHKNMLDKPFDFGGIKHKDNHRHYSGQMLIFSADVFNKCMEEFDGYDRLMTLFAETNYTIADDTVLSWVAVGYAKITRDFYKKGYWTHTKDI